MIEEVKINFNERSLSINELISQYKCSKEKSLIGFIRANQVSLDFPKKEAPKVGK